MSENAVARQIVDAAYRVHALLGPGLLESVYFYVALIKDGVTRIVNGLNE
jgi:PD-(D/E)XK nuclease superfamily